MWQEKWETDSLNKGNWTHKLIPNVKEWYNRSLGELTYELTQELTGHGCFQAYLQRIGKKIAHVRKL